MNEARSGKIRRATLTKMEGAFGEIKRGSSDFSAPCHFRLRGRNISCSLERFPIYNSICVAMKRAGR